MALEPMVVDALATVVPRARVFPDTAKGDTPMPFIIYQGVGGKPTQFMDGQLADRQNARVQVTVWAKGRAEASRLMAHIQDALCGAPVMAEVIGAPIDRHDLQTGFKGAEQDFSIWYSR